MRRQVVICGHSRAGTTLLHEILRQQWSKSGWVFYDEERTFSAADQRDRMVVTKRPLDVFCLEELKRAADAWDLRVLLCIRDPRALLTSRHASVPHDYFYHAHAQYQIGAKGQKPRLCNPGLLDVHDALVEMHRDPGILTQIVKYEWTLGSKYRPGNAPAGMARALNGDRPIDRSRLDAWRQHMPRLADQFTRHPRLFEVMECYGYSLENFEGVGGVPLAPEQFKGVGGCIA